MKLNLGLIIDSLETPRFEYISGSLERTPDLSGICPLVSDFSENSSEILYLAKWEQLQAIQPLPASIVCVGGGLDALARFEAESVTGLIFGSNIDPFLVLRAIQEIFMRYERLEHELLGALVADAPIRTILNCCSSFFEGHIMLFNNEFRLIDYSDNYLPPDDYLLWKETLAQKRSVVPMVPREKVKMLPSRPKHFPYATYIEIGEGVLPHFNYSFDHGDFRFATMIIMETGRPLSAHQHWLVDYIAGIIRPTVTERYNSSMSARNYFRKTISASLRHESPNLLFAESYLSKFGWGPNDDYRIVLISLPQESHNISHYLYNYENIFASAYSDIIALHFDDFILILLHSAACTLLGECLPTLEKQLELDNGVCSIGIQFCDFSQLYTHYSLTVLPFRLYPNGGRIRYYAEIMPTHIISELNSLFPLRSVCHRAAVRVHEYDLLNGTNYLLTLETYLMNNKSLMAAAGKLFIHRSTMTYRLKCIEKIADMTLDDPSERLGILLSCIALRVLKQ